MIWFLWIAPFSDLDTKTFHTFLTCKAFKTVAKEQKNAFKNVLSENACELEGHLAVIFFSLR